MFNSDHQAIRRQLTAVVDDIFYTSLSEELKSLLDQARTWFIDHDSKTLVVRCQIPKHARMIWERYYSFSVYAQKTGLVENFSVYVGDKVHPHYDWDMETARLLYGTRLREIMSQQQRSTSLIFDDIPQGDHLTIFSLIQWMESKTVPLSLTPNDNNVTFFVNEGYAKFTNRPQSDWLSDIQNPRRFLEGELDKILRGLQSTQSGILTDCSFLADRWDMQGVPYLWNVDAKLIKIQDREFRLLHTKNREERRNLIY